MNSIHQRESNERKRTTAYCQIKQKYKNTQVDDCKCLKMINSLLSSESFQYSSYKQKIKYEDISIYSKYVEYLKRSYELAEYGYKIKALSNYYKLQKYLKYYKHPQIAQIMFQNNYSVKKMIRKMFRPQQKSSTFLTSSEKSSKQEGQIQSQICNGILDTPKSSVMLGEICDKIGKAFKSLKPKYYYKGSHHCKQQIQKFKKFIKLSEDNKEPKVLIHQASNKNFRIIKKSRDKKIRSPSVNKHLNVHDGLSNKENRPYSNSRNTTNLIQSKCNTKQFNFRPRLTKRNFTNKRNDGMSLNPKSKPKQFSKTTIGNETLSREEGITPFSIMHQTIERKKVENQKLVRTKSKNWSGMQKNNSIRKYRSLHKSQEVLNRNPTMKNNLNSKNLGRTSKLPLIKIQQKNHNTNQENHKNNLNGSSKRLLIHKSSHKIASSKKISSLSIINPHKSKLTLNKRLAQKKEQPFLQPQLINTKTDPLQNLLKKKLNLRI